MASATTANHRRSGSHRTFATRTRRRRTSAPPPDAPPPAATAATAGGGLGVAGLAGTGDRVAEGGVVARDAAGGVLEDELAVGAVSDVRGTAERAGLAFLRAERVAARATATAAT